jgi:hypothetical protein
VWVRASGYAWKRVELDLFAGGRREVALERCGDLELEIVGLDPNAGALLRLYGGPAGGSASPALTRDPRAANPWLLENLPVGTYLASVELGFDKAHAEVWGEVGVEILPGVRVRETLVVDERELGEIAAPVSGTLFLPRAYRASQPVLLIAPLEGGNPARAQQVRVPLAMMRELDPEMFAWSAGDLIPGRYLLELAPLAVLQILEVRPGGEHDVHIAVETPGELVIVPFDAQTGERIAEAMATWIRTPPEGLTNWTPARVLAEARTRQIEISAPCSEVSLNVSAPGYAPSLVTARIESGRKGISVPLEKSIEVDVELFDGTTRVPYGASFQVDASQVGGEGRVTSWKIVDGACRVALSNEGVYRFSLRVPAEFSAAQPQEIDVRRASSPPVRFVLSKRE